MTWKPFNRSRFNRPTSSTVQHAIQIGAQYAIKTLQSVATSVKYCIDIGTSAVAVSVSYNIVKPTYIIRTTEYCIKRTVSCTQRVRGFNRTHFNRPTQCYRAVLVIPTMYGIKRTCTAISTVVKYTIYVPVVPVVVPVIVKILTRQTTSVISKYCVKLTYPATSIPVKYTIAVGTISVITSVRYCVRSIAHTISTPVTYAVSEIGAITIPVRYLIVSLINVHEYEVWTQQVVVPSPGSVANFSCTVTVPYASGMNADFSDVRFSDTYEGHMYAATRVSYTPSTTADFLVEVPTAGLTAFWMYYGNTALSVQNEYVNPSGATTGSLSGSVLACLTFLWRYITSGGGA